MSLTHPSTLLKPEWVEIIHSEAAEAEHTGLLQPKQLELIYRQHWFKLLVPKVYSGEEKPLPEMVRLEESLAWADGSFGWVITLCSGAGWFGGFMPVKTASEVFAGKEVCLAGSGASNGTATKTTGGFIINGSWKYASGANHATHFTANCVVKEAQETVLDEEGKPQILSFVLDAKDVKLTTAWKYIGMMGTGSDAFEVKDVFVPTENSFKIDPDFCVVGQPLYRYPFLQLAEATLAANLSGMVIRFMDLAEVIFTEKIGRDNLSIPQKNILRNTFRARQREFNQTRQRFYQAVDQSWMLLLSTEKSTIKEAWQQVSQTSRELAAISRKTINELYPFCGLVAASPDSEINRVWRDFHTASQHSLLTFLE